MNRRGAGPDPRDAGPEAEGSTTGSFSPPDVRASTDASPAGGSDQSALPSASESCGSGRSEVNSSAPSGRNAAPVSPSDENVSRIGSAAPAGSISHSELVYAERSASGAATVATRREPSRDKASAVTLGRPTKASRSSNGEGVSMAAVKPLGRLGVVRWWRAGCRACGRGAWRTGRRRVGERGR